MVFMILVLGSFPAMRIPRRYPSGLQGAGRAGHHLLPGHAGLLDREDHHQPHRTLGQPGARRRQDRIQVGARRQHRPHLFPRRHRSQRRPDHDRPAGPGHAANLAAQHPASRRAALRSDRHHAAGRAHGQNPTLDEANVKDVARIQVRNMLGCVPGCVAPGGGRRQGPHHPHLSRAQRDGGPPPVDAGRYRRPSRRAT